jgi:glycosyltransferase involved in cell wall biosynthesis
MYKNKTIAAILPALDEAASVGIVINALLALRNGDDTRIIDDVIVCDNGSSDNTATVAANAGARIIHEVQKGYGMACLAAMSLLNNPDIVVFVDADRSVVVNEIPDLLLAIYQGSDLVIGARVKAQSQKGALTPQQRFGNILASRLIEFIWGQPVTDLGPFRAIRYDSLCQLNMRDQAYGWTVEMQVKAIQHGLQIVEVPVSSIKRIGCSKISGTVRGTLAAGYGIIGKILMLWLYEKVKICKAKKHKSFEDVKK